MKKSISLILSGFVGAVIALYGFQMMKPEVEMQANVSPTLVSQTSNTSTPYPFDFVSASEKATKVVVQIDAKESIQLANNRFEEESRKNPYGNQLYLDDYFGGFFGRRGPQRKAGSGSGVIVSTDGYIVTNNHVAGFADEIEITLADGKKYNAERIGTDPSTDLALLKIEAEGLPVLSFADSDDIKVGEWVLAVGNPFSYLTSTVTAGIVSAKGRDIDIIEGGSKTIEEFIQTDAAINPGNSGGALVDNQGRLVGINTAIATPTGSYTGYSFAIPSNLVKRIIKDLKENGDIERGVIGIEGGDLNPEIVEQYDLSVDKGILITRTSKSAKDAGLLSGDIIVKADNKNINEFNDLVEEIKFKKAGEMVSLVVYRNDVRMTIDVILKSAI